MIKPFRERNPVIVGAISVAVLAAAMAFAFSLDRLTFLAPELRARIRVEEDWPVLDRNLRSTDPNVVFVGYPAEGKFGPISRFVLGTKFAASRAAAALAS